MNTVHQTSPKEDPLQECNPSASLDTHLPRTPGNYHRHQHGYGLESGPPRSGYVFVYSAVKKGRANRSPCQRKKSRTRFPPEQRTQAGDLRLVSQGAGYRVWISSTLVSGGHFQECDQRAPRHVYRSLLELGAETYEPGNLGIDVLDVDAEVLKSVVCVGVSGPKRLSGPCP